VAIFTDPSNMKRNINVFTFGLTVLLFLTSSCNSRTQDKIKTKEDIGITSQTKKSDYELAGEFLNKLKGDKADTIIFYKRTCINCCDFFNVFWVVNGQQNLTKFYFDFDDLQTHSKTIGLKNSKVFDILDKYFEELKSTSIKGNSHKNKDGTSSISFIDHYCYAEMKIYTKQDSIITDRMKDHDFDEYTDFGITPNDNKAKRQTNDNYKENINSKWNLWLTTIENEIAAMPATINREKETLRTR
jgi:hypothetical protein